MGYKRLQTLGDLSRHGMLLRVQCQNPRCRRMVFYRAADLSALYGRDRHVKDLRFACSECGLRMVLATPAPPEDAGLPSTRPKPIVEVPGKGSRNT